VHSDHYSIITQRKDSLFNKWCLKNWTSAGKRLKLDLCLVLCTDISSEWIKDLKVSSETVKLLQERTGKTLEHVGIDNNFLNGTSIAQ
jgi:hypothetical protein